MKGSQQGEVVSDFGGAEIAPSIVAAAHELKSPLALMRQLTLGIDTEALDPEAKTALERILLTSERALRLTTDITKHARLEDSLFELEPLNPAVVCEDVAHELSPLFAAHQRQLVVSSRSKPRLVIANRELLRRILLGFGDNALHYSGSDEPVQLQVSTAPGSRVRIGVRDRGPAMPARAWSQLQQSLGTSAQPLHSRPGSSGLGLVVARQFAEAMHGTIGLTRHRDGASFYVDLEASTQLSLL